MSVVGRESRFRMPAEWSPHRATWLAWPHNVSDWPGKSSAVAWGFAEIVRRLSPGERVGLLVENAAHEQRARARLARVGVDPERLAFGRVPTDRAWLRDSGPTFVLGKGRKRVALAWRFNAWAKYDNWRRDDRVAARVAALAGVEVVAPTWQKQRVVLEGGAIDVDGAGTLLATEECLLSDVQARNPGLNRQALEAVFAEYLGATKVIWLKEGIVGDDTHGHIDDVCRFVGEGRVVLVHERNPGDDNHRALAENRERLEGAIDAAGRKLDLIALPMPEPLIFAGRRLPASYANFYIGNESVLVPTFNDPNDRIALGILAELFPSRKIVGIHSVDLIWGFGSVHCLSQQEPSGSDRP